MTYGTIDEILTFLFETEEDKSASWAINKSRFLAGKLSKLSKERILKKKRYVLASEETYRKRGTNIVK